MQKYEIDAIVNELTGFMPVGDNIEPIPNEELIEIENYVSGILPDAYKLFAQYGAFGFNTYVFSPSIQPIPKTVTKRKAVRLGIFLGSKNGAGISILESLHIMGKRFPEKTVPFNFNNMDYFIIDLEETDNYGKVYYFVTSEDIDDEEFYELNKRKISRTEKLANCYLLANSFEDFLKRLCTDPEQ